jgi:hypothetical protein
MLRAPKTKKDFEHLVILLQPQALFDTCRRILMTAEESKDSANGDVCCKYGNGY